MSAGLMVYLVSEEQILGVLSGVDPTLLPDVLQILAPDIEALDEEFATESEYGPGLTFTQAMTELLTGTFSRLDDCRFMYVYAFEQLCRSYGEWLSNRHFCPCRYEWFQQLDKVLAEGNVPLRFDALLSRPIPGVPDPGGDPCLGHWRNDELAAALQYLQRLVPSLSGDEKDTLASVQVWLEKAVEQPGSIIVGVYC